MGKLLYGLLFVVLLPAGLIGWAYATTAAVNLPAPLWPRIGWTITGVGLALLLEAMRELWFRGGGLPMNAFPPARLVTTGVYAWVPHPIYSGFCAACGGISIATGSASGLWLVSPVAIAACAALVIGYEGPATARRFGTAPRPMLRPPDRGDSAPTVRDRLVVYLLLFAPWLVLYEGWGHAQAAHVTAFLPGEQGWPVWEWTTYIYSLAYPFTLAVPLAMSRRGDLRRFFDAGVVSVALVVLMYIVLPVHSPLRAFDRDSPGGWLLALERADGLAGAVSFPSYHVVWAIISACAYGRRGKGFGAAAWIIALAISAACVTTGMHSVWDVALAVPFALLAWNWSRVWAPLLNGCERIANSWSCLRIGPVRIINYAAYAGISAFVGMLIATSLAGPGAAGPLTLISVTSLIGAGLWGQALVGSPTLLRPFGYFGAILGAGAGLAWVAIVRGPAVFWLLSGALTTAAPWIVLLGRFRCLVQGCCHGHATETARGIRYRHPQSRVCRIAHLSGVPVHPTPLYSMVSNAIIGLLLARLWSGGAPLSMSAGVYLLLAGLTRFVEESRRGEPQTQIIAGLRIYHWFAIASVVMGAAVTTLPSPAAPGVMTFSGIGLASAVLIGLLFAFAMGVDFPDSNRRFSRLV